MRQNGQLHDSGLIRVDGKVVQPTNAAFGYANRGLSRPTCQESLSGPATLNPVPPSFSGRSRYCEFD